MNFLKKKENLDPMPEIAKEFTINGKKIFLFVETNNDRTYTVYQYFKSNKNAQTSIFSSSEYKEELPEDFSRDK